MMSEFVDIHCCVMQLDPLTPGENNEDILCGWNIDRLLRGMQER